MAQSRDNCVRALSPPCLLHPWPLADASLRKASLEPEDCRVVAQPPEQTRQLTLLPPRKRLELPSPLPVSAMQTRGSELSVYSGMELGPGVESLPEQKHGGLRSVRERNKFLNGFFCLFCFIVSGLELPSSSGKHQSHT